jgi:2-oxoisovalerate dehydrogenase E2 component (dihydrolipoyl transacylase)
VSDYAVKLPDVGEGVAEAELVSWLVAVGETVTPDSALAEVMTDKATVEISSPVTGVVAALHGEPGDILAVGAPLVTVQMTGSEAVSSPATVAAVESEPSQPSAQPFTSPQVVQSPRATKALAAPAVRARAQVLGINLSEVSGTGPDGRVLHADLDAIISSGVRRSESNQSVLRVEAVRGLRRRIADQVTSAWTQIPHITYVEGIDVTELEAHRAQLNTAISLNPASGEDSQRVTLLAMLVRAIVIAVAEYPRFNAHYDSATQKLSIFESAHVGIATQTEHGLMVPVIRGAEALEVAEIAAEIRRVSTLARDGAATVNDLNGSTITVTSLAALGGLVTTPIINQPEVAIVGVNKIETRPVWFQDAWVPRSIMNLSSSFDHRIIDGWDAAGFIQRIKVLLETPSQLM